MTKNPLHEACGWDGNMPVKPSLEKARELLESGHGKKYLEAKTDSLGLTPLHCAALVDKSGKIVDLLIQHGANIEARSNDDYTPLIIASVYNNPSTALVLLQHGANIKAKNEDGNTALHRAFRFGYKEVAEIILDFVVDSTIASSSSSLSLGLGKGLEEARNLVMNIRSNNGNTALDLANPKYRKEKKIIHQWWVMFQVEKEERQQQQLLLERTDPAMDALWPHALHKAGKKKSISQLWYFVQMKGPSLIAESRIRSGERGQAPNLKQVPNRSPAMSG